ncbi:MAG: SRPBCC family protein [Nitrospirae bacterium]|nr:SRPBCC family protein [Nitrospirota bacterium]
MTIIESIIINAPMKKVWDIFTDLTCWKDWSTIIEDVSSVSGRLAEGKSFKFCIRPFDIPIYLEPVVEEIIPGQSIIWTGKKHGITARHEFTFQAKDDKVILTSRETFTGILALRLRFFFPKQKIQELSALMLKEIKQAAEGGTIIPDQHTETI